MMEGGPPTGRPRTEEYDQAIGPEGIAETRELSRRVLETDEVLAKYRVNYDRSETVRRQHRDRLSGQPRRGEAGDE